MDYAPFPLIELSGSPRERGRVHSHDRQEEVYLVLAGTIALKDEIRPEDRRATLRQSQESGE